MKRKNKDKKQKGLLTAIQKKEICLVLIQKPRPKQNNLAEQYGSYLKSGEGDSAPQESLKEERAKLYDIISNYDYQDIFNCDETALHWQLEPDRSLATKPLKDTKKSKNCVTILLTCNALGTEKLLPLIDAYERSTELQTTITPVNILDAINFCVKAWKLVKEDTIKNCWRKTGILSDSRELSTEIESDSDELSAEIKSDIENVQRLIDKLDFKEPMMAEEYINIDDNVMTEGGLTDEEIVEM
ncbi:16317_t:CDS:2, partial [Acaulospora morrowiae]